jgi:6-phosphogluconate dehydrogenase
LEALEKEPQNSLQPINISTKFAFALALTRRTQVLPVLALPVNKFHSILPFYGEKLLAPPHIVIMLSTYFMEPQGDIALIGLAVMGQNLIMNMNDHGFTVVAYNRTTEKVDHFLANEAKGSKVIGAHSIEEMVSKLKSPRRVMMLVKAGKPVDDFIEQLIPHLSPGDIIIDGGNSLFDDTSRRVKYCESKGLLYVGTGVSGGEEGARHGPSIMPGGSPAAWPHVKDIFQGVSAKVESNVPCCDWVGEGGAGHYVKMVHNGIEYGDMQLIGEAYNILKNGLGMSAQEIHEVFAEWNQGELDSYLIEISRDIMAFKDEDGSPLVDKILDTAGQKGTGKWTVINSLDMGIPITLMAEAVYARCVSALKDERVKAARKLKGPRPALTSIAANPEKKKAFIADIMSALYASKIVSYAQGYMLMRAAAKEYKWNLNYGGIALMWRGGCIIRSRFLGKIKEAYDNNPKLTNLLLDDYFRGEIKRSQKGWRNIVATAAKKGIPVPAFSTALAFYDQYRSAVLPANLLQAQRDYFGAHTYERVDKPRGEFFHTNWTGRGGTTSSSTYNV